MRTVNPSGLTDRELEAEVTRLAGCERGATVSLIASLAELYGRRLHERAGFSSLFTYCMDVLRLSEHEAYDRMKAAKVVRRYPIALGLLAAGEINLTTVRLLAPHLTRRNHEELLAAASGKRKRQVQELLARWFPKPDVVASVRKLPARTPPVAAPTGGGTVPFDLATPRVATGHERSIDEPPHASVPQTPLRSHVPAPTRPLVSPLAPDRYKVTFTATTEMCENLELAQDLLRHSIPDGDPAQVVARALDVLVEQLVKQKFAVTDRVRTSRGQKDDSRNIPAEVKRAVFIRDRGRCVFIGAHGRKCGERAFVEFHHVILYAAGGRPTAENIELRCHAHNAYEADLFFGPARRYLGAEAVEPSATLPQMATDAQARVSADAFRSGTTAASEQMPAPTTGG